MGSCSWLEADQEKQIEKKTTMNQLQQETQIYQNKGGKFL